MNIKVIALLFMVVNFVSASQHLHSSHAKANGMLVLTDFNNSSLSVIPKDIRIEIVKLMGECVEKEYSFAIKQSRPGEVTQSKKDFFAMSDQGRCTLAIIFNELRKQDDENNSFILTSENAQFVQNLPRSLQEDMFGSLPNERSRRIDQMRYKIYTNKLATHKKPSIFIPNQDDSYLIVTAGVQFGGYGAAFGSIMSMLGGFGKIGLIMTAPLLMKITLPVALMGGLVGSFIGITKQYIENVMHRRESNICGELSSEVIQIPFSLRE